MCLYIQNQNFQTHTEHMMNELWHGAETASNLISEIVPAMEQQSGQLQSMHGQLHSLQQSQSMISRDTQQSLEKLQALNGQATLLEAGMQESLANEVDICTDVAIQLAMCMFTAGSEVTSKTC